MPLQHLLASGRRDHRRLMRDTITVTRPGLPTFDPSTGTEGSTATTVYSGPADVKAMSVAVGQAQAGEREITTRTYDVKLPFATVPSTGGPRFLVDDLVTVSVCEDPGLVGLTLHVIDPQHGARRTALHLIVEDRS